MPALWVYSILRVVKGIESLDPELETDTLVNLNVFASPMSSC